MGFVRRLVRVLAVGCACLGLASGSALAQQPPDITEDDLGALIAAAGQAVSAATAIGGQRNTFYRRSESLRMAGSFPDTSLLALRRSTPPAGLAIEPIPARWAAGETLPAGSIQTASLQDDSSGWSSYLNANLAFTSGDTVLSLTRPQIGFDTTGYGFTLGADRRFGDSMAGGFAIGYGRDVTGYVFAGDSNTHALQGVFYGSFTTEGGLWVDAVLSAGWLRLTMNRPTARGTATGQPDSPQLWGGLSGGYDISLEATTITPYARVNGGATWFQAFTETGPGAALAYTPPTFWSVSTVVGLRLSHVISTDFGVIAPYARGEYVHDFGNSPNNNIRVLAGPGAGVFLIVPSPSIDRNFFNAGGGVSMQLARAWALFADYDGLFGYDNISRHVVTAGVRKEF